jgi:hypothetical protein
MPRYFNKIFVKNGRKYGFIGFILGLYEYNKRGEKTRQRKGDKGNSNMKYFKAAGTFL